MVETITQGMRDAGRPEHGPVVAGTRQMASIIASPLTNDGVLTRNRNVGKMDLVRHLPANVDRALIKGCFLKMLARLFYDKTHFFYPQITQIINFFCHRGHCLL